MKYSELNSMSNYQLNLLLLKKEIDWEDLQDEVEGKDHVNWGDGFNWYSYEPTGDISLAGISSKNTSLVFSTEKQPNLGML